MNIKILLSALLFISCTNGTPPKETTPQPVDSSGMESLSTSEGKFKQLFVQKKFSKALNMSRDLLKKRPNDVKLLYYAGFASFNLGDKKSALAYFEASLKAGGSFADLYINLSETLFFLKQFDRCATIITSGLKLFPNAAGLYYNMGGILIEQGNDKGAIKWLNKALLAAPSYPPALISLGALYFKTKQIALARRTFSKLVTVKGYELQGLLKLAYISISQKDYNDALSTLKRAAVYDSKNKLLLRFVAYATMKKELAALAQVISTGTCAQIKTAHAQFLSKFPTFKKSKELSAVVGKKCP